MATGKISKKGWKSVTVATLPWTVPEDGFLFAQLNPSSSSTALYYIMADNAPLLNLKADSGVRVQGCAPVQKGQVLTVSYSSNVGSIGLYHYIF